MTKAFAEKPPSSFGDALQRYLEAEGDVPERKIAAQFGVTRHALRRVLADLRATGRIPDRGRQQSGPRALQLASGLLAEHTNPIEILELRLAIEPMHARLAALRASPAEIARIRRAVLPAPSVDYSDADLEFHRAVAAGARNALAGAIYDALREIARTERAKQPPRMRDAFRSERAGERDREHGLIAEAIAAREPMAAEAAMRAHLAAVQGKLLSLLVGGGGEESERRPALGATS